MISDNLTNKGVPRKGFCENSVRMDISQKADQGLFMGGMLSNAALSTNGGHTLTQVLAGWINTPNQTIYDKAIDSIYLQTHLGGSSLHHLIDGQHDIFGAFRVSAQALPNDSLWQEITGVATHLGKDLFSVSGLPMMSIEPGTYAQYSTWIKDNLGISKAWQGDFLQINGLELFSGMLAIAAVLVGYKSSDINRLSELCGASGLASILSANPIASCAAALALVLAWRCHREKDGAKEDLWRGLVVGAGTASASYIVGTSLAALGMGGSLVPALVAICISLIAGMYVRKFLLRFHKSDNKVTQPSPEWEFPANFEWMHPVRQAMRTMPYPVSAPVLKQLNARLNQADGACENPPTV